MGIVAENISNIKAEIGKVELIAVSKKQPVEKLREALLAGHGVFGENRVQEAAEKFPSLREEFDGINLHLIGPLQTNKVKDALKLFDVIQTLDREKLANKIANELEDESRTKEFMVQVNIGEEEQKAGISPQEAEEFTRFCMNDLKLNITGFMCIPPADEQVGMYFALLKNIAMKFDNLKLSMGMSSDYLEAIEMGADYVRVGSAVFGARAY